MPITPTPFGGSGGAEDSPDYVTSTSPASGSEGVAEEIDKLGDIDEGIENRVVLDETAAATVVSAAALGTANNPVTSASAARPQGLAVVYWYTATQPTNWVAGDVWDSTTITTVSGAIIATNNGSDFADAGAERYNTHVPALTPAAFVATANISSLTGNPVTDGYTPAATDIGLLVGQTTASQNGLWLIPSGGGAWTRPAEFPAAGVVHGRTCRVLNGTTYTGTDWALQAPTAGVTIGSTAQTWINTTVLRPPSAISTSIVPFNVGVAVGADPNIIYRPDNGLAQFQRMVALGIKAIRIDAYYGSLPISNDGVIQAAMAAGLGVLLVVDSYQTVTITPSQFATFVTNVVTAYNSLGTIVGVEVGNEINWYTNINPTFTVTDGVTTSGSATFTSATSTFTSLNYVGQLITTSHFAAGTYVASVTNATTAVASANATASGTAQTITYGGAVNPAAYVTLIKACYTAVKAVNAAIPVLSGASGHQSGTPGAAYGGGNYLNFLPPAVYLADMYAANSGNSTGMFDGIAVHPYTFPSIPSGVLDNFGWDLNPSASASGFTATCRSVMVANGDTAKTIWITEFGAPTADGGVGNQVTYGVQQQSFLEAFSLIAGYGTFIPQFFCFNWSDNGNDGSYGLVDAMMAPKPSLGTVAGAINPLGRIVAAAAAAEQPHIASPGGTYNAQVGEQVPVTLGTTTSVVLPIPVPYGKVFVPVIGGSGTLTVTVVGSGTIVHAGSSGTSMSITTVGGYTFRAVGSVWVLS